MRKSLLKLLKILIVFMCFSSHLMGKGRCVVFKGSIDSYVEIPNSSDINPKAISVEAWVYSDVRCEKGKGFIIVCKKQYRLTCGWGKIRFSVFDWSTGKKLVGEVKAPYKPGKWYHIIGTFEKGKLSLYLNGKLSDTAIVNIPELKQSDQPLRFGKQSWGDKGMENKLLPFRLDEVRIYSRALSFEEVKERYEGKLILKGLIACWTFDDKTAKDLVGLNHGVLYNVEFLSSVVGMSKEEKKEIIKYGLKKIQSEKWYDIRETYHLQEIFKPSSPLHFQWGVLIHTFLLEKEWRELKHELEKIKRDGFDTINIGACVWTPVEKNSRICMNVENILKWCEENDINVWFLFNLQFPHHGEFFKIGNNWCFRPKEEYLKKLLKWVKVLKTGKTVCGLILGNEVSVIRGRTLKTFLQKPILKRVYHAWLRTKYPNLEAKYANKKILLQRFLREAFANFYAYAVREIGLKEGPLNWEVTSKILWQPFLHSELKNVFTVLSWDHSMTLAPNWALKVLSDITPYSDKLILNSEVHGYHDKHDYVPTKEKVKFAYRFGLLHGEWWTISYDWSGWTKKEILEIHKTTMEDLKNLTGKEDIFKNFLQKETELGVVLTEIMTGEAQAIPFNKLVAEPNLTEIDDIYIELCNVIEPWRYVLDYELNNFKGKKLLILSNKLSYKGAQQLYQILIKKKIKVFCKKNIPEEDLLGRKLPKSWIKVFKKRIGVLDGFKDLVKNLTLTLPEEEIYRRDVEIKFPWWIGKRVYPTIKVKMVEIRVSKLKNATRWVALINNLNEPVKTTLPQFGQKASQILKVLDYKGNPEYEIKDNCCLLGPYEIAIFKYKY